MRIGSSVACLALLILLVCSGTASAQFLNAYAPWNAVAAEPGTPYNLDQLTTDSRVYYMVCPTCGPASQLLPDVPPPCRPFPGPLGIPVPLQ
jgi:hypothetical protein